MMTVPDEHRQRRVLRRLAKEFPGLVEVSLYAEIDSPEDHRTLFYLAEKGLVEAGQISERPGRGREMLEARITAKGLDWLETGNPQQVRRAEMADASPEALRQFLVQSLNASDLPNDIRAAATSRLLAYSDADMKALHVRLIHALAARPEVIADVLLSRELRS